MRVPLGQWARLYSTGSGGANNSANDIVHKLLNEATGTPGASRTGSLSSLISGGAGRAGRGRLMDDFIGRTVSPPPRTGVYAGRTVAVDKVENLPFANSQITQLNRINRVREVKNLQRYHERPGKAKWRIRMTRKRREFRAGMRMLFHLALEAKKRGL